MKKSIIQLTMILSLATLAALWGCENGGGDGDADADGDSDGDGDGDGDGDQVECSITSPEADDVVNGEIDVEIDFQGPVTSVELSVDGDVVEEIVPDEGDTSTTIEWDTTDVDDGSIELVARVVGDGDLEHTSETVEIIVDNTEPVISLDIDRMSILVETADIPVSIEEENVVSVRLLDEDDEELFSATEATDELSWDTTEVESKVYWIRLEVEDIAGNVVETEAIPVLVGNNGYHVEQNQLFYDSVWVIIPEVIDPLADMHIKVAAPLDVVGSQPYNVERLVTWLTWNPETAGGMPLEYQAGQGICPHRGIPYIASESDSGEVIIDLAWADLPITSQDAALIHDPDHPADATTFPNNDDYATCGAFFGHVAPMDMEEYLGVEFVFEANFFYIFGE